jgi:hypothetical protein
MGTPNVNFILEYNLPYAPGAAKNIYTERRDFVSCSDGSHNLYNYLTRPGAADKNDINTIEAAKALAEHTEASEQDLLSYAKNRPGSTGAFDANGDISEERAAEIRAELQKTKSIIWSGVLSFEEEYGKKFCNDKAAAQKLIKSTLKSLFAKSHLKYENIEWYAALHENTDNRHIHICFWEKEPTFTKKGSSEYHFAERGKFRTEALDNFKFAVAKYFEVESMNSYKTRDAFRADFRKNINTERRKEPLIAILDDVKKSGSWQYARQKPETQDKILKFAMDLIKANDNLKAQYDKYVSELIEQQQKYLDICNANKLTIDDKIKNFANNNINELHNRIGNDVLYCVQKFEEEYKKFQYDNSREIEKLLDCDLQLIKQISQSKAAKTYSTIMKSHWDYSLTDSTGDLKGYHAHCLKLMSLITCFAKTPEQAERLFKASPLYKPEIWNKDYKNEFSWVKDFSVEGKSYGEVLSNYCLKNRLSENSKWQHSRKAKSNDKILITKSTILTRSINKLLNNTLTLISGRMDNSFNQFRNALKEQERKRQKAEGTIYE